MSAIEWTGKTWNPWVGCSLASPGCTNCYAMTMSHRLAAMDGAHRESQTTRPLQTFPLGHYAGTTKVVNGNAVWTGAINRAPLSGLRKPFNFKRPTTFFVCSMSDFFHDDVPEDWIADAVTVMAQCPQHTFQLLTKRPARMRALFTDPEFIEGIRSNLKIIDNPDDPPWRWPLPNVWCGTSCEDQRRANERIPDLLATPAAVHFVSGEPLLGPIDFNRVASVMHHNKEPYHMDVLKYPEARLDWVIVGAESGHGSRPMNLEWVRSIRDQCVSAGTAFFFKQDAKNGKKTSLPRLDGRLWAQMPSAGGSQ